MRNINKQNDITEGFKVGELHIICAKPKVGKSSLAENLRTQTLKDNKENETMTSKNGKILLDKVSEGDYKHIMLKADIKRTEHGQIIAKIDGQVVYVNPDSVHALCI